MQELKLTPTSYIVLGLLEFGGESTPYGLKQLMAGTVGHFWTLQHAQLYTEPERLAAAGYLTETREQTGRRRRLYAITEDGRAALAAWRDDPATGRAELREPALLKLFFGADSKRLAAAQLPAHRAKLEEYEAIRAGMPADVPPGPRQALEVGIRYEREFIDFWEGLAD
ncbi:MAG TPA: PadR family transcriptional regulator [Thermoleophilaceae bacterium]|jgi:DNA-binding PadR family transcriptional regulator